MLSGNAGDGGIENNEGGTVIEREKEQVGFQATTGSKKTHSRWLSSCSGATLAALMVAETGADGAVGIDTLPTDNASRRSRHFRHFSTIDNHLRFTTIPASSVRGVGVVGVFARREREGHRQPSPHFTIPYHQPWKISQIYTHTDI